MKRRVALQPSLYRNCIEGGGGGGGGVTSVYVRLCPVLFGFYEKTDVFFGTLADIDKFGRTLADSDGHWWTRTDIDERGRTLVDRKFLTWRQSFRARVAKKKPAFRDRITKGNPRVQNCLSKGRCGLWKPKNYFRLMIRVAWNMSPKSSAKNSYNVRLCPVLFQILSDNGRFCLGH